MKKLSWLLAPALVLTLWIQPALAEGSKTADTIWVAGTGGASTPSPITMKYGDTFNAGWQSSKTSYPWALAQCWAVDAAGKATGAPFWSEYRALQADGTIGVFDLMSADPRAVWPSSGGSCNLSLVVKQGSRTSITATSPAFAVTP
jgi:hypothetical protein